MNLPPLKGSFRHSETGDIAYKDILTLERLSNDKSTFRSMLMEEIRLTEDLKLRELASAEFEVI